MIDVVFLLLVFFMLAARFGSDMSLPLGLGGEGEGYQGLPRIVDVLPESQMLNGSEFEMEALLDRMERLTEAPTDTIILRARDGAVLQRIVDVMQMLEDAGYTTMVLVE